MIPALKPLYDYAWFVGFFAAGCRIWSSRRGRIRGGVRLMPEPRLGRDRRHALGPYEIRGAARRGVWVRSIARMTNG